MFTPSVYIIQHRILMATVDDQQQVIYEVISDVMVITHLGSGNDTMNYYILH